MVETAKNMIENFLFMVDTYGFVPNGGRVYYLQRSQVIFLDFLTKISIPFHSITEFRI